MALDALDALDALGQYFASTTLLSKKHYSHFGRGVIYSAQLRDKPRYGDQGVMNHAPTVGNTIISLGGMIILVGAQFIAPNYVINHGAVNQGVMNHAPTVGDVIISLGNTIISVGGVIILVGA